jgi:transposase InsO family protein
MKTAQTKEYIMKKRPTAYLKMKVLGAVEFAEGASIRQRIKIVSEQTFLDEDAHPHQFTWRTISTWFYRYKIDGTTAMINKTRSDKGKTRKVSPEQLLEAIEKVLPKFRGKSYSKALIYRTCIEDGLLRRDEVAPNTFSRLVNEHELLKPESAVKSKRRLAFAKAFANQCWQADTLFGPYVKNGTTKTQVKLIAFIDDASRLLCHGEFFFADNIANLITAFQTTIYKRGIPEQLYVDNGSNYASLEISNICTRIGTLLCHTPVRDGAAKGKIERFFRTVRAQFLARELDLSSLTALNRQFLLWAEKDYNCRTHSTLQMKPIDRFGMDLKRIRFLSPERAGDELFYIEKERNVLADNTFRLNGIRYEAPADLHSRKIQVRFNRHDSDKSPVIVYYKGHRIGIATPLDFTANDRHPNQ